MSDERRKHHAEPGDPDRPLAEVPHVGVQGLAARDHQHHRSENQESLDPVAQEELHGVPRIHRPEHRGIARDPSQPEQRDRDEPHDHDGPEDPSDPR